MTKALLTLNTGSSSIKFCLFSLSEDLPRLADGEVSGIGNQPIFTTRTGGNTAPGTSLPSSIDHEQAVTVILNWLDSVIKSEWDIVGIAHRIVHGGLKYTCPVELNPHVMADLQEYTPLAPLHQPHNLAGIKLFSHKKLGIRQFACFDTAFHSHHDPLHYTLPLPENIRAQGIRRYGFHGLSYKWIARCLGEKYPHLARGRVIVAHLGNGASLCAIKNGASIDTTMSMTTLDGLPMGTRSGSLDPGVLVYIQRELGISVDELETILYKESGLKGLSSMTNNVKELLLSHDERARFALDYFYLKTAQFIASMAVTIGGIDGLIFTAGIGENASEIRQNILAHLTFLPPFESHVLPANEERCMALEIYEHYGKELLS